MKRVCGAGKSFKRELKGRGLEFKIKISQMRKLRHQDERGKHGPAANLEKGNSEGNNGDCPERIAGRETRSLARAVHNASSWHVWELPVNVGWNSR